MTPHPRLLRYRRRPQSSSNNNISKNTPPLFVASGSCRPTSVFLLSISSRPLVSVFRFLLLPPWETNLEGDASSSPANTRLPCLPAHRGRRSDMVAVRRVPGAAESLCHAFLGCGPAASYQCLSRTSPGSLDGGYRGPELGRSWRGSSYVAMREHDDKTRTQGTRFGFCNCFSSLNRRVAEIYVK